MVLGAWLIFIKYLLNKRMENVHDLSSAKCSTQSSKDLWNWTDMGLNVNSGTDQQSELDSVIYPLQIKEMLPIKWRCCYWAQGIITTLKCDNSLQSANHHDSQHSSIPAVPFHPSFSLQIPWQWIMMLSVDHLPPRSLSYLPLTNGMWILTADRENKTMQHHLSLPQSSAVSKVSVMVTTACNPQWKKPLVSLCHLDEFYSGS
jgi:hypothetical protein